MRTAGMTEPISGRQARDPRWVNFLTPEKQHENGRQAWAGLCPVPLTKDTCREVVLVPIIDAYRT